MANTIRIEGSNRTEFGKGAARRMRVAQQIPATIYAGGTEPTFIALPMKETTNALRRTNALFELKYDDGSKMAVVKDVQRNPVKRQIEHIDFLEVRAGEKVVVEVPVFVEGETKGAAVAFVDMQNLEVRADVTNLPERIVVNVEGLADGEKVLAKDVELPEGSELVIDDPEDSVVTVEVPKEESLEPEIPTEAPAAADAPADGDAAAADAE
ncbi:50S ribosomal protein L25/general stress protein Ctc [Bifidobacterium crudilactis]|uniref:50S ribosomal protein L25/general stress protein Ctc n=1 Tax=Bifidobacterium crudilactis TaxID=327277 RepID=UPI002648CDBE|nr:50S ribosomal protein L25/general stress protein Ctc [Bifidobacterium crudilactis]MDN5972322.1 50S ribosomal protein L25/general stress protein Ctc [Bifidobacterium crudilactis]MDN6001510.1 50S ribosomal protein L25/general stress protein Ctc [Bifidobacterium crudilactis]MDN6210077.1 50S ribosomal protein L25/general stress protein Ctc [Bifidobacterium crudilactis]MDN6458772.1 50S ribosomal protein L25/general stress protein Ctc [Bifidobacterium crudilactis]MDN6466995.1 50S ribosomal protei